LTYEFKVARESESLTEEQREKKELESEQAQKKIEATGKKEDDQQHQKLNRKVKTATVKLTKALQKVEKLYSKRTGKEEDAGKDVALLESQRSGGIKRAIETFAKDIANANGWVTPLPVTCVEPPPDLWQNWHFLFSKLKPTFLRAPPFSNNNDVITLQPNQVPRFHLFARGRRIG